MPTTAPASSFLVDRAAELVLEHPPLSGAGMFQLAFALDGYELRRDPEDPTRRIGESLTVEVLDVKPTRSTIRLTPRRDLSYLELLAKTDSMLEQVGRGIFDEKPRLVSVTWDAPVGRPPSSRRPAQSR
jgi:hypothetical protein